MDSPITPECVSQLARFAGFTVPAEDLEPLTAAVVSQAAMATSLQLLDFSDVLPITSFDPRWE